MVSTAISVAAALAVAAVLLAGIRGADDYSSHMFQAGMVWGSVFLAASILIAVLSALGMVEDDPVSRAVLSAALVAGAAAEARASSIAARFGKAAHPYLRALAIVAAASACAMLALELPSNHALWGMAAGPALLEFALIFCLLAILYFLPRRHGALAALGVVALAGVGLAEYFVVSFKSMPIQPGDLFALGTAAAVAGGYTYVLSPFCVYGIASALLGILGLSLSWPLGAGDRRAEEAPDGEGPDGHAPDGEASRRKFPLSVDRRTAIAGAAALAVQPFIDYYDRLGIRLHTWLPLDSYYSQGFLPTFISSAQKMVPPKPARYRRTEADALIGRYAAAWRRDAALGAAPSRLQAEEQFDRLMPSIVCIMNESFADLSIFDGLRSGYQGPVRFNSLPDALFRGVSYMSAFGAGTCNSEFEFLTGQSMSFLGSGVYPYMTYNLAPVDNLARQFKKLGYRTVAMHPNHGTNWNRENVFSDMGFDEFLTIDDFTGAPELCRKVTDAATFDKCLEILRESDGPVLIHDVTMQNHSGYATGLIPADRQLDLACPGVTSEVRDWTDEYCALMEASDEAYEDLISALRGLDRPVIVIMYGDHQPFFTDRYNDLVFPGEEEVSHAERIWQTEYAVWANYDVAGAARKSDRLDTSIGYVGALALQAVGAPLTDYQKARLALRAKLPAINVVGFQDARGAWHQPEEKASAHGAKDARDDLERMQYRTLFDHDGSVFATRKQSQANQTDAELAPGADA